MNDDKWSLANIKDTLKIGYSKLIKINLTIHTLTANVYLAPLKVGLGGRAECVIIFWKHEIRPNFGITPAEKMNTK